MRVVVIEKINKNLIISKLVDQYIKNLLVE